MKIKIILILIIITVLVITAFAAKRLVDNSVTDKYGMVREYEDDITENQ